jgi:DNA-binding transcriptional regulator YiaG
MASKKKGLGAPASPEAMARIERAARRSRRTGTAIEPLADGFHPTEFEAALLEGMLDVVTMERGGKVPGARITKVTARTATSTPAPTYSATQIKRLRAKTKLSQTTFAQALNVSAATVRAWEIGQKTPSGAALRLLQWAERNPQLVVAEVHAR